MDFDITNYQNDDYWDDRIVRITRDASYELMIENLDKKDLLNGLNDAVKCPGSRRRRNLRDCCTKIYGVEYKIVLADDVVRDFRNEPCWTVTHIKPYSWSN